MEQIVGQIPDAPPAVSTAHKLKTFCIDSKIGRVITLTLIVFLLLWVFKPSYVLVPSDPNDPYTGRHFSIQRASVMSSVAGAAAYFLPLLLNKEG